ncbi:MULTISPECIES: hypothetical protein [Brevibacillus]|uniref:Uncharacterized protein n=1 Tax=Brevibacillus porteri TaxID=2126350 RepID=A0ABX5FTT3_9BACL|nr:MULTISPECIES: hypothetical protein [Brevibacillus]MDC0760559.1 hypothetical protein [Brevibacillus sp. AG]MED1798401.1 hypothetical protein [Brevibacillus porteri]MED2129310.1 hypothetical protein [Brevibacillus porteri]MED2748559.1 hypothetical protein [Brevibacillus porteri]MED2816966.1 hypothetical protein [Brevibacillus porteri]
MENTKKTRGTKQIRVGKLHRYIEKLENDVNNYTYLSNAAKEIGNSAAYDTNRVKAEQTETIINELKELFPID